MATSAVNLPEQRDDSTDPSPADSPGSSVTTVESRSDGHEMPQDQEHDRVLHFAPHDVVIVDNVREDGVEELDPDTVRDMRQRGIDTPTVGYRADDGTVMITTGQRRVLHAREAGCQVPVWMKAPPSQDERRAGIERIVQQVNENDLRQPLSLGDQCRAVRQLAAFGLTPRGVARKLSRPVPAVRNMLSVVDSDLAVGAAQRFDLDLEQAAVVAEFEAVGDLDTAKDLIRLAVEAPRNFAVVAERKRRDRAEDDRVAQRTAELTTELTQAGVTIVDQPPSRFSGPALPLTALRPTASDAPGTELTPEAHASCRGHLAWLDEDWDDDENRTVVVHYYCADFRTHGHAQRHAPHDQATFAQPATPGGGDETSDGDSGDGGGRDQEQVRLAERARRRWVIENNKLWDAAIDVRRAWLASFAQRKTAPRRAQQFLATHKARGTHALRRAMEHHHELAHTLLNLPVPGYGQSSTLPDKIATATTAKATVYDVYLTLCAIEADLPRHAWRSPDRSHQDYLRTLIDWGYNASDVERKVLDPDDETDIVTNQLARHDTTDSANQDVADVDDPADDSDDTHDEGHLEVANMVTLADLSGRGAGDEPDVAA